MKVLGKRVLIEQTMKKKKSAILLPETVSDKERFEFSFKVLQIGPDCPEDTLEIGDNVIFATHMQFIATKVIEKSEDFMRIHSIVHYDDIAAVDNEQGPQENSQKESL